MSLYKVVFWREFNKEIYSLKVIMGYLTVIVISIMNYRNSTLYYQEIFTVLSGIFILSTYNSTYFYNNITTLLCLPISINEFCVYRSLYKMLKIVVWGIIYTLYFIYIKHINIVIYQYLLHCGVLILSILGVCYVTEYLLLLGGKKYFYPVLIVATILIFIIGFVVMSKSYLFYCVMLALESIMAIYVYKMLEKIDVEKIIRRWI